MLRRLWTDELVTFDGTWHHLDRIGLNPMPVQRPIPIWMGSFVGQVVEKVIRRIGRLADGWFPQMSPAELAPVLERLRGYAVEAGPRPRRHRHRVRHRRQGGRRPRAVDRAGRGLPRPSGATHLRVMTAGGGFTTPAGAPRRRPALDRGGRGRELTR